MANSRRSLAITDRFSSQLKATSSRVLAASGNRWRLAPDDFDGSYQEWVAGVVPLVAQAQRQNLRLAQGYLSAFLLSETGRRVRLPKVDPDEFVGRSRDGRALEEAWGSPPIKAKVAIGDGKSVEEASAIAKDAALHLVDVDTYHAARGPLAALMATVTDVQGYTRVTGGDACGACLGAADGTVFSTDEVFEIHANCDCVAEPVVEGADRVRRESGQELFERLSLAEQNARLGDETAEAVRSGLVTVGDLVGHSPMKTEADWLSQKPLSEAV